MGKKDVRKKKDKEPKNKPKSFEADTLPDIRELSKCMEECQTPKRYYHTLGVAFTAASLAMKYDYPIKNAQIAGLLHDCAKCLPDDRQLELCEKYNLQVSDVELRNPFLLHGKVGSLLAQVKYGVADEDILNAITYHTTGRPGMSLLEKIIFTADYIEPGRKEAPHLEKVRRLAFTDLDQAVVKILKDTLSYLAEGDGEIDPMTNKTYEYYCKEE